MDPWVKGALFQSVNQLMNQSVNQGISQLIYVGRHAPALSIPS